MQAITLPHVDLLCEIVRILIMLIAEDYFFEEFYLHVIMCETTEINFACIMNISVALLST